MNTPTAERAEFPGTLADPDHVWKMEREANGFTVEEQQEFHDLKDVRIPKLKQAIESHAVARWSPADDEKLWAQLPGEPRKFPWDTLPASREFHERCVDFEHASFQAAPSADGKRSRPRAQFQLPDIPVPQPDDIADSPRIRLPRLRAHHAYLLAIIEWHASHKGHDLCWENNAILALLLARLQGREASLEKPPIDTCLEQCMRFRGSIERALERLPVPAPSAAPAAELVQLGTERVTPPSEIPEKSPLNAAE